MISILICTHNRADILPYCLDSLLAQTASQDVFEVIVIDNKSHDHTQSVSKQYSVKFKNFRYVVEDRVGLSHARNRGYKEARYEWVNYLDDDAKAHPDYVERILLDIESYGYDCFGGRFLPWYIDPKPKWLAHDFGEFPLLRKDVGVIPANQYVPGGVIVFRKTALIEVGGFPAELGMSGNTVGYGEENWVQDRMRERGYVVGFDPELKIDHLVASYKFTLKWHFKRQIARGKASRILGERKGKFRLITWAMLVTIKQAVVSFGRLLLYRNYYHQNYLLDTFGFLLRSIGYLNYK